MATQREEHIPVWTLGDRLRKARRDARIGTTTMAGRLECHRNTVLGWETDKAIPPLEAIVRWSRATHVPLSWLLDDFDPPSTIWYRERPSVRAVSLRVAV